MLKALSIAFIITIVFAGNSRAEEVLLTALQQDAPPRYFKQQNQDRGICIDIVNALNGRLKSRRISIKSIGAYPLARLIKMLEENQIQIFVGLQKTPERERIFCYVPTPLFEYRIQLAKLESNPFEYTDKTSLKGKTIGLLRGADAINRLTTNLAGVGHEETASMQLNLKKLTGKRLDLLLYHHLGLSWEIKQGGFENEVVLVQKPLEVTYQYILLNIKTSKRTVSAIDDALKNLKTNGTIDKILKAYR